MSDVRAFIQALQQNLIEPLQRLPLAQLKALDTAHNQSVIDFQNAIGQLYAPPGPFTGRASAALADLLADYYAAENALTAYTSDDLSERISKLIQFCQQVVSDLEPKLKDLQETDPTTQAGAVAVAAEAGATGSGLNETPAVPLVQLVIAGIVGTIVLAAQTWQEGKLWDAYDTMHHWEMNMDGLAAYPESVLPANPFQIMDDVNIDLPQIPIMFDGQQIPLSEGELAQQLFEELGGAVTLDDILQIIQNNPGLSADQYRLLIEYYRRSGKMPYGVVDIVGVGVNKNGKPAKLFYITRGDIAHIRTRHPEFDSLSDAQLLSLIEKLLQEKEPDATQNYTRKGYIDYFYDDVMVGNKYLTIVIRISTDNPGRIISVFQEVDS